MAGPVSTPVTAPPKAPPIDVRIIGGMVNSYIVSEGNDHYLIDAGFSDGAGPILAALSAAGIAPHGLKGILLTHQHMDHIGGAARLHWVTGAPVGAHRLDAKAIEGVAPRAAPLFVRLLFNRHPVKVTNPLGDRDTLGPFTVIHLPGHTPGSAAYYHKGRGLLFTGDALINSKAGNLSLSRKSYDYDHESAAISLKKLSGLSVSAIYPGHGEPVTTRAAERLSGALERLTRDVVLESRTLVGPEGRPEIHPGMPGWREG